MLPEDIDYDIEEIEDRYNALLETLHELIDSKDQLFQFKIVLILH